MVSANSTNFTVTLRRLPYKRAFEVFPFIRPMVGEVVLDLMRPDRIQDAP
jgi:hypothetical protein